MYLKFFDGTKLRIGNATRFKISPNTEHDEIYDLKVSPCGGTFETISNHHGKENARRILQQILDAINRGDKVFEI